MAVLRYVNTASSGGDGTTNNTTGATAAYAGIEAAITALEGSLSDDLRIICCGSTADTISVYAEFVYENWTMNGYSITVEGNEDHANGAHEGSWSSTHYRMEKSITANYIARNDGLDNVIWKRFQIRNTHASGGTAAYVFRETDGATSLFDGMIIRVPDSGDGIYLEDANGDITVRNSLIINDTGTAGDSEGIYTTFSYSGTLLAQNTNIYNFNDGIEEDGSSTNTITNCAIFENDSNDLEGTYTITYTATDQTYTGTGNINSLTWADEFTSVAGGDFSIVDTDSQIYDAGTDLSGTFTTDLAGVTRAQWDIGALSYVAVGPSGAIAGTTNISLSAEGQPTATGLLSGDTVLALLASGIIAGSGSLNGNTPIEVLASGNIAGSGALSGNTLLALSNSGEILGTGSLSGSTLLSILASGEIQGGGSLSAESIISAYNSGILTATAELTGESLITINLSGDLSGGEGIKGDTTISLSCEGLIGGLGSLSGSTTIALLNQASISASGELVANNLITLSASGELTSGNFIYGDGSIGMSLEGAIQGTGSLVGAIDISISPSGQMSAGGALSGDTTISIDLSGTFYQDTSELIPVITSAIVDLIKTKSGITDVFNISVSIR